MLERIILGELNARRSVSQSCDEPTRTTSQNPFRECINIPFLL